MVFTWFFARSWAFIRLLFKPVIEYCHTIMSHALYIVDICFTVLLIQISYNHLSKLSYVSYLLMMSNHVTNKSGLHMCDVYNSVLWIGTASVGGIGRGQCCGSGFVSTGSTCFWASWILLSLSKISKKNLNFYSFVTFWGLFMFEKWCPNKKVICRKTS